MVDEGADKDFIWMGPEDEAEGAPEGSVATDAEGDGGGSSPSKGSDDDSTWVDDPQQKRTVLIAQIALVILVLIGVAVILAVKSNNDDKSDDKTAQTADDTTKTGDTTGGQTTPTTKDGKPAKPEWPATVKNRPAALGKRGEKAPTVKVTAKPGVYVWEDFDGWHMWIVGGAGVPEKMTGLITSNDELGRADLAVPDTGVVTKGGTEATFDLQTNKPLTGVDFAPGFFGKKVVIVVNGPDGSSIDAKLIHTGSKGAASSLPLTFEKTTG